MSKRNDRIALAAMEYVRARRHADTLPFNTAEHAVWTQEASRLFAALNGCTPHAEPSMSPYIRGLIMHMLGADDARPRRGGHRNYYAPPSPGNAPHGAIEHAVKCGWMQWGAPYQDTRFAHATEAGARAAGGAALSAWRRHAADK